MATVRHILEDKGYRFFFVTPYDTVLHAVRMLTEKRIGAVLVMDGERLVGIFSERDLVHLVEKTGQFDLNTPVGQVMTGQVLGVSPDTTVDECMALMTERRFRHLPVMKDNMVVGVLSIGDIVKEAISDREVMIRGLEAYIAVREFPT